jgi:hypothetical protein
LVDEGVLPPWIRGLRLDEDFFRYYPPGTSAVDDEPGNPAYELKWADKYWLKAEEDELKQEGLTTRRSGQQPPRSGSSASQRQPSQSSARPSGSRHQPQSTPNYFRLKSLGRQSGDIRLREADYVAEDARWTTTRTADTAETWTSAPGAYASDERSQPPPQWRGQSRGSGASGSSGSRDNTAYERRQPSSKKRASSINKIDKTRIEPESDPSPQSAPDYSEEATRKESIAMRHQHIIELADTLERRLRRVVDEQGASAIFTASAESVRQLLGAILSSRHLDSTYISEAESGKLLKKLQQIDEEYPALRGSASSDSKGQGKGYRSAAEYVPPSPSSPEPEPEAIFRVVSGRTIWQTQSLAFLPTKGPWRHPEA